MSNMQKRLADQGDISTLIKLRKQQLTDERPLLSRYFFKNVYLLKDKKCIDY